MIVPPYLQQGDIIGVICPSGYMPLEKVQTCLQTLQQWGFKTQVGKTVGNMFSYFSGTDEERLNDLQAMLDDANIKTILCARGGYGLSRIIDEIDFSSFIKNPKWIIGYSDITLLHSHIYNQLKIASLHSPMANAFNDEGYKNEYILALKNTLFGLPQQYECKPYKLNRTGISTGALLGGNLAMLAHATGTASDIETTNAILFIEDVGEYLYSTDRMLQQLKRAGKLKNLAALIVGSFTEIKDTVIPYGASVYDIIYNAVKEYNYPVCFDFPVGHTEKNYPLKIGVTYNLSITENKVMLAEN